MHILSFDEATHPLTYEYLKTPEIINCELRRVDINQKHF